MSDFLLAPTKIIIFHVVFNVCGHFERAYLFLNASALAW